MVDDGGKRGGWIIFFFIIGISLSVSHALLLFTYDYKEVKRKTSFLANHVILFYFEQEL